MNHLPTTHASLLSRFADREDRLAWEEFSRLYSSVLNRVAAGRGLRSLDADELVQEVLIAVMQAIENFEHGGKRGSFRRWLLTVAKNTTINKICRRPFVERIRDASVGFQEEYSKYDSLLIKNKVDRFFHVDHSNAFVLCSPFQYRVWASLQNVLAVG